MFRFLKERSRTILSMLKLRIDKTAPEPGILGKESQNFKPTSYVKARGESVCNLVIPIFPIVIVKFNRSYDSVLTQIIFENINRPPPGYVSVPAGNIYISRNCRRLTRKSGRSVYAEYVRTFTLISLFFFWRLTISAAQSISKQACWAYGITRSKRHLRASEIRL